MIRIIYAGILSALIISSCSQSNSETKQGKEVQDSAMQIPVKPATSNLALTDSIEQANNASVIDSGADITKAFILSDSSFDLTANIRKDHRFFGYKNPDTTAERLILFSVFTNDVENNPFGCKLGSYYQSNDIQGLQLKYEGKEKNFVKVYAIDSAGNKTLLYFQKKWIVFE